MTTSSKNFNGIPFYLGYSYLFVHGDMVHMRSRWPKVISKLIRISAHNKILIIGDVTHVISFTSPLFFFFLFSSNFFFSRIILGEGRERPGDEASLR